MTVDKGEKYIFRVVCLFYEAEKRKKELEGRTWVWETIRSWDLFFYIFSI